MLTRRDMQRVAESLPTANQLALDTILPGVNQEIRRAAQAGLTTCRVDIPAFVDTSPAYDYPEVCQAVVCKLHKGSFTVTTEALGLYVVSWAAQQDARGDADDEVRIIHARRRRGRK